jgi:peptidoglycan-N-acetylglucosamine deacetylase
MSFIGLFEGVVGILFLWLGVPHLLKLLQIANLRRRCRSSKVIVLTYDDGPGKVLTPALLNLLASNNVHANFFMIGSKVESFPTQVLDVVAQGHAIGSHSFRHLHAWKYNPFKVLRDIHAGFRICKQNSFTNWFRPPFGKMTLASLLYTWISHHKLAWWTIDSTDTWPSPLAIEKIIERVRKEASGVVLMHDNDRADISRHDYVLNITLGLIQLAHEEGFNICTLQDKIFKS